MTVTTSSVTTWWLHKYVEKVAMEQFKLEGYLYGMWEKRTLSTGDHQYQFNIFDRNTFSATDALLTEGVTPASDSVSFTPIVFDMVQYGRTVTLSDLVVKDNPFDIYTQAAKELWRQMAQVVDGLVQDALVALDNSTQTQVIYGTNRASRDLIGSTDYATAAQFASANAILESKWALKKWGAFVAIAHPLVINDILTNSSAGSFLDISKYSQPENLFNGEIGKLFGVRFVNSPAIKKFATAGSGGIAVYPTYIVWQDAYGIVESQAMETIIKPIGSGWTADPLNQRGTVSLKIRFGVKVLKPEANFRIESAVSLSPTLPY